ncbi:MAG TPA: CPBP family intramembrane glutamic endopeptidase [Rhizomicrobium sp.]|nr:CPBP family intramembrane glutamic endopeptidase [Rhizomicrobium sp.]
MQDATFQTALSGNAPAIRPLRWWDLALPLLAAGLALALVTAAVMIVAMGHGGVGFIEDLSRRFQAAGQGYYLNLSIMAVLYLPPIGLMFWLVRRKALEFFAAVPGRVIGWAFGGGILYAIAFEVVQDFLIEQKLVEFTPSPGELLLIPHDLRQLAFGLFVASVIGPFAEEFYFRGFLLSWCRGKVALVWAALINAVLFGIVHFYFLQHPGLEGIFVTTVIALFGALNVWWTVRTGSLWPAFASHAAYNGAGLILMFLAPGSAT